MSDSGNHRHQASPAPEYKLKAIYTPRSPHLRGLTDAWQSVQYAVHTANEKNISRALILLDRETILSYIED